MMQERELKQVSGSMTLTLKLMIMGRIDSDYFNIEDIEHYSVLKEQIIDIENLPKEEISPDLVEGDRVFVWDAEPDPAVPSPAPSTFIGVVTEVIPEDDNY